MIRNITSIVAALAVVACFTSSSLWADSHKGHHNTLTEQEKEDGWKLLFDGKTLKGWMSWKTKKPLAKGGKWVVKDGALTQSGKGGGDVYTEKPYEHFEWAIEWKATGNSGLFYRVDPKAGGAIYKVAPESQVIPDGPKSVSSTSSDGLYAIYELQVKEKKINPKGWNKAVIRILDNKATHWFNGQKVLEYTIGSDDWNARLAKSKFKNSKGFGLNANGHLGMQDHGHIVAFRNIKIRVLKSAKK